MEESINYIISKYFISIKDKIDFAVSVLENPKANDNNYSVRNIVESIANVSLDNLEREIKNNYPSFEKLESYVNNEDELDSIKKNFKSIYETINLSVCDFLNNNMEKDNSMALNSLIKLDKEIDNYINSFNKLEERKIDTPEIAAEKADKLIQIENNNINELNQELEKIESESMDDVKVVKPVDLENTLDEIDEVLDSLVENQIDEQSNIQEEKGDVLNMDNEGNSTEEYNVDEFLKHISESQKYFDKVAEKFNKGGTEASDKFTAEMDRINKEYEQKEKESDEFFANLTGKNSQEGNSLEPVEIPVNDLNFDFEQNQKEFNDKYITPYEKQPVDEDMYMARLDRTIDRLNKLFKVLYKQKKNSSNCKKRFELAQKEYEEKSAEYQKAEEEVNETQKDIDIILKQLYSSDLGNSPLLQPDETLDEPKKRI